MSLVTLRYGAGRISPFEAARVTGDRPDRGRQEVISNCCCEGIAVYHFSGILNIHMGKDDRISKLTSTPARRWVGSPESCVPRSKQSHPRHQLHPIFTQVSAVLSCLSTA